MSESTEPAQNAPPRVQYQRLLEQKIAHSGDLGRLQRKLEDHLAVKEREYFDLQTTEVLRSTRRPTLRILEIKTELVVAWIRVHKEWVDRLTATVQNYLDVQTERFPAAAIELRSAFATNLERMEGLAEDAAVAAVEDESANEALALASTMFESSGAELATLPEFRELEWRIAETEGQAISRLDETKRQRDHQNAQILAEKVARDRQEIQAIFRDQDIRAAPAISMNNARNAGDVVTKDFFISHRHADESVATRLVELLREALDNPTILATSVKGFGLEPGQLVGSQLRSHVVDANVVIGLIGEADRESAWVLFELGARWGADKALIPVLIGSARPTDLPAALSGVTALTASDEDDVWILLDKASELTGRQIPQDTSTKAAIRSKVRALVDVSKQS